MHRQIDPVERHRGLQPGEDFDLPALIGVARHRPTGNGAGVDLVLTDVYLKGKLEGRDLLRRLREDWAYGKRELPVLVMTGDANPDNQADLLREGANDLVLKPIEERLLVTKALFQLRLSRLPEQKNFLATDSTDEHR